MIKSEFYDKHNQSIAHANMAFENTIANGKITDPAVVELALGLITDEQNTAIAEMNKQFEVDYADAERMPEASVKRLGEIAKIIAEYEQADEDRRRQLGILAEFYAQAHHVSLTDHENAIEALRAEQQGLEASREISKEENEHLFMPWNVPVHTTIDSDTIPQFTFPELRDWQNERPLDEFDFIDEFPDPRELTPGEMVSRLHEWRGRLNDAGRLTVYVMATNTPGMTWTAQKLGDELYPHDERDAARRKENAKSLITNYHLKTGSTIPQGLRELERELGLEEGAATIQIGRRWQIKNGNRFGKGERISRLIITDHSDQLPEVPEGYEEVWGTLEVPQGVSDLHDDIMAAAVALNDLESVPSFPENELLEVKVERSDERQKWQVSFRAAVEEQIDQLAERGLVIESPEGIATGVLRSFGSASLGTETCFTRGVGRGILDRVPNRGEAISVVQVVALSMQNAHDRLFAQRARRGEAIRIIEQTLTERLKAAK